MRRSNAFLLTVALGSFGLLQPTSSQAQAVTETQFSVFPVDLALVVPCADRGRGEVVQITGQIRSERHVTTDANDGYHIEWIDTPQLSGTGLTTGDKYQVTGVNRGQWNVKAGSQNTYVDTYRVIGGGTNFTLHDIYHFTINANGETTVFFDNFSPECK